MRERTAHRIIWLPRGSRDGAAIVPSAAARSCACVPVLVCVCVRPTSFLTSFLAMVAGVGREVEVAAATLAPSVFRS